MKKRFLSLLLALIMVLSLLPIHSFAADSDSVLKKLQGIYQNQVVLSSGASVPFQIKTTEPHLDDGWADDEYSVTYYVTNNGTLSATKFGVYIYDKEGNILADRVAQARSGRATLAPGESASRYIELYCINEKGFFNPNSITVGQKLYWRVYVIAGDTQYLAEEHSCTVSLEGSRFVSYFPEGKCYLMGKHTYHFENLTAVIGTDIRDRVWSGSRAWRQIFGYQSGVNGADGQCYGMAVTAAASAVYQSPAEDSYCSGYRVAGTLYDITPSWVSTETNTTASSYIAHAHLFQVAPARKLEKMINEVDVYNLNPLKMNNFKKFLNAVESYQETNTHPVIIHLDIRGGEHALWALGIISNTDEKAEVAVYDCNYPGEFRTITFYKKASGNLSEIEYSYFSAQKNEWVSFTRTNFSFETSAVEDFLDAWNKEFAGVYSDAKYDHLMAVSSKKIRVSTSAGYEGVLSPEAVGDCEDFLPFTISAASDAENDPDLYYVSGNSELRFTVPSSEQSVQISYAVKTDGIDIAAPGDSTAIISVPEKGDMKAEIRSAKSEDFSISYNQTIETDLLQTITVTGSSKNVQTEETGQGIEVRAEDLGTVEIELSREGEDLDRTVVQASGDHLLITVNNDEVTAMEDRNGDGKYETPAREAGANPFTDVKEGAYYFDPVLWAVNHVPQITNGTSATTFSPDATCTRGQVVTFLWRAMGCPEPKSAGNPFKDVKEGDYYYKAVLWAAEKNVTNGTSATTFSPNNPCTRAHVVTFLWRAHENPAAGKTNPFTDVTAGQYYTDAVLWAVSKNITNGTSATTFSPGSPCTRGQIVTFLYRDMK